MMEKKREDTIENIEEEPNFSDPEDYIDDITDEGVFIYWVRLMNYF